MKVHAMAQTHEWIFYELMWRANAAAHPFPLPWWIQQYFRHWVEHYDQGLFDSREAAFASNAYYRYWNMVGVKDHHQESLVGQAGEVEPVYEKYTSSFFLFEPESRVLHFPQFPIFDSTRPRIVQRLESDYLPIVITTYRPTDDIEVRQEVFATTVGHRQRSVVLVRFNVTVPEERTGAAAPPLWLCVLISPIGPTGFERRDRAGRISPDRRLTFLKYRPSDRAVEANTSWGPIFSSDPDHFGLYGNEANDPDPDFYLSHNPFRDLAGSGMLNGNELATDHLAIGAFQ
jgi:hypothetical protein